MDLEHYGSGLFSIDQHHDDDDRKHCPHSTMSILMAIQIKFRTKSPKVDGQTNMARVAKSGWGRGIQMERLDHDGPMVSERALFLELSCQINAGTIHFPFQWGSNRKVNKVRASNFNRSKVHNQLIKMQWKLHQCSIVRNDWDHRSNIGRSFPTRKCPDNWITTGTTTAAKNIDFIFCPVKVWQDSNRGGSVRQSNWTTTTTIHQTIEIISCELSFFFFLLTNQT